MKGTIEVGDHVFIFRANDSFPGQVMDTRRGWVRVAGQGSMVDVTKAVRRCYFDEWFPLQAPKMRVTRA